MTGTPRRSQKDVAPALTRLVLFALIVTATPNFAQADGFTFNGLERVATSITWLAAAIAFAGIVIAVAIWQASRAGRSDDHQRPGD